MPVSMNLFEVPGKRRLDQKRENLASTPEAERERMCPHMEPIGHLFARWLSEPVEVPGFGQEYAVIALTNCGACGHEISRYAVDVKTKEMSPELTAWAKTLDLAVPVLP